MSLKNNVSITGRITRDIQVNESGDFKTARATVAVTRSYKNKDGEYDSDFIPIVAFGKKADFLENYFNKGDAIMIGGEIRTGSYTNKDGQKVYTTEVAVNEIDFALTSKKSNSSNEEAKEEPKKETKKAKKKEEDDFMNISEEEASDLPW